MALLSQYLAWKQPIFGFSKKKLFQLGPLSLIFQCISMHIGYTYFILREKSIFVPYSDKCVHYEFLKAPASCWSLSKGQLLWDITLCLVVVVFFATCLCWLIWLMHQKTCLEGNDCSIEGAIREFWDFKATFLYE